MPPRNRQRLKKDNFKELRMQSKGLQTMKDSSRINQQSTKEKSKLFFRTVEFQILLSARLCAAVWSNISDCDEVFNYWEPAHFLLYGSGFQTWEYSPLYAIRSYAYIIIHAFPASIYSSFFQPNRILVFYFTRCLLAILSATCEAFFCRAVSQRFNHSIGRLTLLFLLFGAGMFISCTAFLPSTFSMYFSTVALGAWYVRKYELTVISTAASTIVGWPFAIILSLPAAVDILIFKKKFSVFVKFSVISLILILVPVVTIDSLYFGKLVIAPLNIVMYNVFTSHGPDLYGTEPWTFYFLNGFLNFNFVFVLALVSVPLLYLLKYAVPLKENTSNPNVHFCLVPMYLWVLVFFVQAHKEERFLFPIYPMLCLAAAITVQAVQETMNHFVKPRTFLCFDTTKFICVFFCITYAILGISRAVMTYRGYHAPLETFMDLSRVSSDTDLHPLPQERVVNICIGKEWYRFPSSFFLPQNWELKFLKSDFKGQLPKPYSKLANATAIIPTDMNDMNLEEKSRYVNITQCDYLVDSDFISNSPYEPLYSNASEWEKISSTPFLDSPRSPKLLRAFYIPYFTDFHCNYVGYHLLQNVRVKEHVKIRRKN